MSFQFKKKQFTTVTINADSITLQNEAMSSVTRLGHLLPLGNFKTFFAQI